MKAQLNNSLRTLVVDDSHEECALLNAELRSVDWVRLLGFVHDGIEAILYLRGVEQFKNREAYPYPDLLLLDFNMPRCGGMGVLEFLHQAFHRPRVVLWSHTLEKVNVPLALRLGADMVCKKPMSKRELVELLCHVKARALKMFPLPTAPVTSHVACVGA